MADEKYSLTDRFLNLEEIFNVRKNYPQKISKKIFSR